MVVTGYVADADIAVLIGNAVVFAFPSRYEGFGLPVLEAQLLGVPVVASSAASIPEVAGDGALLFDPRSAGGDRKCAGDNARRGRRARRPRAARAHERRQVLVGASGAGDP
ncbi:MAG: glycosyltransferase [Ilumatobacteraceae bacterium]